MNNFVLTERRKVNSNLAGLARQLLGREILCHTQHDPVEDALATSYLGDQSKVQRSVRRSTCSFSIETLLDKRFLLSFSFVCVCVGGLGNNIPLDLHNEFLNHVFKDIFRQTLCDVTGDLLTLLIPIIMNLDITVLSRKYTLLFCKPA